jgi:protocatechuate 3,4-dioxygenase beta subunit
VRIAAVLAVVAAILWAWDPWSGRDPRRAASRMDRRVDTVREPGGGSAAAIPFVCDEAVALEAPPASDSEGAAAPGEGGKLAISGRVVAAENGAPIAGATIWAHSHDATSRDDGRFLASVPEGGFHSLRVTAKGRLPRGLAVHLDARRDPGEITIELDAAEIVEGVVTDEAGHPIPDACVWSWQERATSGPDGTFAVTAGRDPGRDSDDGWLYAGREGHSWAQVRLEAAPRPIRITLPPADVKLAGRVQRPDGTAIAAASVSCNDSKVETDAEGRFVFEKLPRSGRYDLFADAAGFGGEMVCVSDPSQETVMILEPPSEEVVDTLSGSVVDDQGTPIAGATVTVASVWAAETTVRSAADGAFSASVKVPSHGGLAARAEATGYVGRGFVRSDDGAPVRLMLHRSGRVRGRLVDSVTGVAIRHATLKLFEDPGASEQALPNAFGQTAETADFDFIAPNGLLSLRAEASGYVPLAPRPIAVAPKETTDIGTLTLTPAGTIEGIVRGSTDAGAPVAVWVGRPGQHPTMVAQGADCTGWFRACCLAPGAWEVFGMESSRVRWPGGTHGLAHVASLGTVEVGAGAVARVDARMPPAGTLRIVVKAAAPAGGSVATGGPEVTAGDDAPAQFATIWRDEDEPPDAIPKSSFVLTLASTRRDPFLYSGGEGSFGSVLAGRWVAHGVDADLTIPVLRPGEYRLSLSCEGRRTVEASVKIEAGVTRSVTLDLPLPEK